MPKKIGLIFTIAGTVLILAALSIFLYNKKKDEDAGQNSQVLLSDVQQVIEARKADGPSASEPLTDDDDSQPSKVNESLSESDKVALVDGYECIGYLSIPDLDLNLPILSEWDYDRLDVAPCRQFGSVDTNDLVIAGHNYENHFGRLKLLEPGAVVIFTDMDGVEYKYRAMVIDILAPTEVSRVQNSGYDLVLYTCTLGGKTRVTVFLNRIENSDTNQ